MTTIDEAGQPVEEGAAAEEVAAPPADVQRLLALRALQHGVKTVVDAEAAAITDAAAAVWRKTRAATTYRHPAGTVSLRTHKDQAAVTDPDALLDHVLTDPKLAGEVEVITTVRVRPAYVAALLKDLVIVGGQILNKATGEVVDIPGVSIVTGADPDSISVGLSAEVKAAAEAMARARVAELAGLPELPAPPEGGEDS